MQRINSETQPARIQDYQVIDRRALIDAQKKEKRKQRLRENKERLELERQAYLKELARKYYVSYKDLHNPKVVELLLATERQNNPITDAHIKGSKSHPEIATNRKKGDAKKLRRKRRQQSIRF